MKHEDFEITPEMTATAIMMQESSLRQMKMIGKVCEALLSGKINREVVSFAEEYLYINQELFKDKQ